MGGCMQVGGRNLQLEEDEEVDCGAGSQIADMWQTNTAENSKYNLYL